jgi:hypothetical protein
VISQIDLVGIPVVEAGRKGVTAFEIHELGKHLYHATGRG